MNDETDNQDFDYDLNHYSLEELLNLFSLNKDSRNEDILYNTNNFIEIVKQRNQINLLKFYK